MKSYISLNVCSLLYISYIFILNERFLIDSVCVIRLGCCDQCIPTIQWKLIFEFTCASYKQYHGAITSAFWLRHFQMGSRVRSKVKLHWNLALVPQNIRHTSAKGLFYLIAAAVNLLWKLYQEYTASQREDKWNCLWHPNTITMRIKGPWGKCVLPFWCLV